MPLTKHILTLAIGKGVMFKFKLRVFRLMFKISKSKHIELELNKIKTDLDHRSLN